MSPPRATHLLLLSTCLLAGACQRDASPAAAGKPATDAQSGVIADFGAERVWQGVLPCSDCQGIDTRLVLREEGKTRQYRLEETYLGADAPNHFERKGRWTEAHEPTAGEPAVLFVLDPERAPRRFRLEPDGGLELLTGAVDAPPAPEYRLQRL
jgi:copper homeostasis protein (lipoprotein)